MKASREEKECLSICQADGWCAVFYSPERGYYTEPIACWVVYRGKKWGYECVEPLICGGGFLGSAEHRAGFIDVVPISVAREQGIERDFPPIRNERDEERIKEKWNQSHS